MGWSYLPHTDSDRLAMLQAIGVNKVEDLFADIPAAVQLNRSLDLPEALPEQEVLKTLQALAGENANLNEYACFLGAGAYDHYIPSVINHVLGRSEFYTAYTQYQAEISQGYLQALWEYQSMICLLTGMDVANASVYDGGTAIAEAGIMACNATGRNELIATDTVHPNYREVLRTYTRDRGHVVHEIGYKAGTLDLEQLNDLLDQHIAGVIIQSPNFFGCIEDINAAAKLVHAKGALLIVAVDPISLGVLEPPAAFGADIVVGEGQSLGLPISFGGPYLGFFATTNKLMRKMPGRIIGQTTDFEGTRGFVLTLQAREQHIRREKATSNICSNQALCALAAAVYLSALGKQGIRQVANLCLQKAHYAYNQLLANGCKPTFQAPFFKEFAIQCTEPIAEINAKLYKNKMIGGLDLSQYYPELDRCMLVCVTEKRTKNEIDSLVSVWGGK